MKHVWTIGLLIAGLVLIGLMGALTNQPSRAVDQSVDQVVGQVVDRASDDVFPASVVDGQVPWEASSEAQIVAALDGLKFAEFVEVSYRLYLLRFPQAVTYHGLASQFGIRNDGLDNYAPEYLDETRRIEATVFAKLQTFDRDLLAVEDQSTFDACEAFWSRKVAAHAYAGNDYLVTQSYNCSPDWLTYDLLSAYHPRSTVADIEDYITRLSLIETQIGQLIDGLTNREARGIVAPKPVLTRTRELLGVMGYTQIENHPFFFNVALMVVSNDAISESIKRLMLADAAYLIDAGVCPAYKRLLSKIAALEKIAPETSGVPESSQGVSIYEHVIRESGETELSGSELHEWAQSQISSVQEEIVREAASLWHAEASSFEQTIQRIVLESRTVADNDILLAFGYQLSKARNIFQTAFTECPLSPVHVAANPVIVASYRPASIDGSREAELSVPQKGAMPAYLVATQTYRETYPGLHVLVSAQHQPERPLLRRAESSSAFRLGWAAYAERLAWELGAYSDDPYGNLGRLTEELKRAVLVAVDTGIHVLGWSYEQAVDFYLENTRDSEANARMNVLEAMADPGSFVPAFIGFHKILELRDRVQHALGDAFDQAAFHSLLLENGDLPLAALEALVQQSIGVEPSN